MIQRTTLENGIRVITEHIPHAHSVSIGIWVASGSRHETPAQNGVAHFIEHLLFKGTEKRTALDIAREIDSVGGVLNAFTGREYVCYYAKVLHKALPKAVDLLSDIFLRSVFDSDELEKERMVILQEISRMEDSPDEYIHDLFCRNFWLNHPLGMPILGNETSVGGMSREDIISYRDAVYCGRDIIITAAGKVHHPEMLELLNGAFHQVPVGKPSTPAPLLKHEQRSELIEKDLEQVHICLGTKALSQNHPHRYDCYIINSILGGSMSSRLFQEVREKLGLAYAVYSYTTMHTDAGSLVIYAGTSHERLDQVVEILLREIRRLKNEHVSGLELESAREQLKGNILLSLESSDNRMTKLAKNEIYFGRDIPIEEIMAGFDRVTPESLLAVSHEIFDDTSLTLELMGKLGAFRLPSEPIKL